jgi:hypothetical protein
MRQDCKLIWVLLLLFTHGALQERLVAQVLFRSLQSPSPPFIWRSQRGLMLKGLPSHFLPARSAHLTIGPFITRVVGTEGFGDVVSISSDGEHVVRFSTATINDINNPLLQTFFTTDSDVYILAIGSSPANRTLTVRKTNGETYQQQAVVTKDYIAHFKRDGSYVRAVPLDLPFHPMQLGAFANGDFLVSGATQNHEPRVALVKSNGQINRFLTLKGDLHVKDNSKEPPDDPAALPASSDNFWDSLEAALGSTQIDSDGRNLLLIRSGSKTPIFSISPSGEVSSLVPEIPQNFTLSGVKVGRRMWIASYEHALSADPRAVRMEVETYALDPASGKILAHYLFPTASGGGLVCADESEIIVFVRDNNKLQLVKLIPSQN